MYHSLYGFPRQWFQKNVYRKSGLQYQKSNTYFWQNVMNGELISLSSPANFTPRAICQVVKDIRSSQRIVISRAQISKARLRSVNKTRWRRQGKDRDTTSTVVCHFVQGMADSIQSFPFTDYLKHRKIHFSFTRPTAREL